ncbi:SDR family oxidoreductase [Nocardia sp. NPDC046763]|uniref:SDR family oxidoreductase n=1 Tax=Nocardia sp. NPDC046763 TaxID=3155256 RepID=UPI0033E1786C
MNDVRVDVSGDQGPEQRRALITGASRGIGAAIARRLAPTYNLHLGGRTAASVAPIVRELPDAQPWPVDLADHPALMAATVGFDRLDVLIHSAGVAASGRVDELSGQDWRGVMETNVIAVAELTRLLLPGLRAAGGHVVLINSIVGRRVTPGWSAYSASKFAVRAFADALRQEEPLLRVTSVYPGRVDTEMQRRIVAAEGQPYRREELLEPDTVARHVYQLVSTSTDAHPTDLVLWHRGASPHEQVRER